MLELIFQGFFEWIYGMILETWEFFSDNLIDLLSMDFAYLQTHIPILPTIRQSMLAVGWALLIGNLVFQALRSIMAGVGFEAEDPKLLFSRTFVFSFLLLASPQICDLCLNMTATVIGIMEIPDAVDIDLIQESAFDGLACAWLLVLVCGVIVMFQSFKLLFEMAERYFILAMLTICAPLAFGMGGSKDTNDIFTGWCRMYGSMCLLMVLNVVFTKMLFSVLSTVPTGLSVLPWMVLILSIVKVAKKADAIVARIGLNPAITGDSLGRMLPGVLTYMVTRTAMSHATKALGQKLVKDGGGGSAPGGSPGTEAPRGGQGGKHSSAPYPHGNGKNARRTWGGRARPVDVSAEEWERDGATHTTETVHTSAKEQRTETKGGRPAQTNQPNPGKQGAEQTRKTSVPRDAGAKTTSGVNRPAFASNTDNGRRRGGAAPAHSSPVQAPAKGGDAESRSAGTGSNAGKRSAGTKTNESTRITNVPVEKRRASSAPAAQREAAKTTGKGAPASAADSERTTRRTNTTRITQRTASENRAASTVRTDAAGTTAATPTRQSAAERHGRITPPVPMPPTVGKAPSPAQQEKPPSQKAQSAEKTVNTATQYGTAGTAVSTRQSAREERHGRDTTEQRQSVISTASPAPAAPAQQERAPAPKTAGAESGSTPPISSGTAGTNATQTTRLTLREERHGRNTPTSPPPSTAPKVAKASRTARQEQKSRPTETPPISGTAETAPTGKDSLHTATRQSAHYSRRMLSSESSARSTTPPRTPQKRTHYKRTICPVLSTNEASLSSPSAYFLSFSSIATWQ